MRPSFYSPKYPRDRSKWVRPWLRGLFRFLVDMRIPICEYPHMPKPQSRSYKKDRSPHLSQFKAEFFKALAHPLRIRIMDALRAGEVGVVDLSTRLGVAQANLSQQLAILRSRS